jgi:hypothetical protein
MNTIPITSKDTAPYTVVGGLERQGSTGLSAVILNRGAPYSRARLFEELEKAGFDYVISLEGSRKRYDIDGLSASFPFVRFIVPASEISTGEEINIAAQELPGPLFMVLWNDLRIQWGGAERIAELLLTSFRSVDRICTVPVIQNGRHETIPTLFAPVFIKGIVKTLPFLPAKEAQPTLYPFDGIGIYSKERFLRLGGFDRSLDSFYWQLMDFGFRSRLWGEDIAATIAVKLFYEGTITPGDSTADESYKRFYLKNLAPVFHGDHANLPLRRFPSFCWKLKGDMFSAWEEFSLARQWVKTNRYRFRCDARTVAELWGDSGPEVRDHEEQRLS